MKIRSAVPENGCLIVLVDGKNKKKQKKTKKTTAKHIRIRLLPEGGCVKKVKERIAVNGFPSHGYGTSLLPYGITQCYLLPDTSERAPP